MVWNVGSRGRVSAWGAAALVGGLLALSGCSGSGSPGTGGGGNDPYAGGRSYPWSDGPHAPGRLPTGSPFLSDLGWTRAQNAWGPVEKDRSNGEQAPGDGRTLTVGGQTFAKGLGMHAAGEVSYALGGACTTLTAQVGIDDEVGNRGSAVFQVWNGTAAKLYDSGVLRGADGPRALRVDVTGVQTLRLVVTDAGDGISYDHADWGNAQLTCTAATAPATPTGLTATPGQGGIALDWGDNREPDLAGYRVFRAAAEGGPFVPATSGTLTSTAFTDTFAPENATSFYRVVAQGRDGNLSGAATVSARRPQAVLVSTFTYALVAAQPYGVAEAQGRAVNGRVYTFGGFDSRKGCCTPTDRAYVYDPAANTWTPLAPFPGRGLTHAGIASDGANLYVAGGYIANASWTGQVFGTRAVWRYRIADNTYTRLPDLPVERAAGQLEYVDGKLHYFGGTNLARTQDVGDHFVLDLAGGGTVWRSAAPLPNPRHHMGSAVLGGKIYAVGGQHRHDEALVTQDTLNVYDPATNTWATLRPLPRARGHIANSTFVLGGRLIVAGGEVAHGRPSADVTAYDPAQNTWTALTPLPGARASGVGAPLGNGYLYTGGGWTSSGWRATP